LSISGTSEKTSDASGIPSMLAQILCDALRKW
jgi:hypothetical protein